MSAWKAAFVEEWQRRQTESEQSRRFEFPLVDEIFSDADVLAMAEVLLSGQLTKAKNVQKFEEEFAKYVGVPFAVMVNSGSSANLLAVAAASNSARTIQLKSGDEVLIPAVCWSTSVWPLVQHGLKPVFVDVDPVTLNIDLKDMAKKITPRTRGFMAVHILGNAAPVKRMREIVAHHKLIWIEDTCESLGSLGDGKFLGALGDFGTYSFFYSHHITTGEGGMVVCKTQEDVDLLRCLRAHGWSRELSNRAELEALHNQVDPRFLFVNVGYNLRPMEVQGALGLSQLKRVDEMSRHRNENRKAVLGALERNPKWKKQFVFIEASSDVKPSWFGFCALLADKYADQLPAFLAYLTSCGIENRPIVSGNFARQPALATLGLNLKPESFIGAEKIHQQGFFIGLRTQAVDQVRIRRLVDSLLDFDFEMRSRVAKHG
jgi:CDP-6-deoxy-D-xylo-4-hexulose-3-dehydrase